MMTALRRSDDSTGAVSQSRGGGVIILEAGMGLGKTRVLEELAARARGAGVLVLSSRGDAGRAGQVRCKTLFCAQHVCSPTCCSACSLLRVAVLPIAEFKR